jgi:hypothetical protein
MASVELVACTVALSDPVAHDFFDVKAGEQLCCGILHDLRHTTRHNQNWFTPHGPVGAPTARKGYNELEDNALRAPLVLWHLVLNTTKLKQLIDVWGKEKVRETLYIFYLHRLKAQNGRKPNGKDGWKAVPYIRRMVIRVTAASVSETFWCNLPSSVTASYDHLNSICIKKGSLLDVETVRQLVDAFKVFLPALQQAIDHHLHEGDIKGLKNGVANLNGRVNDVENRIAKFENQKGGAHKPAAAPTDPCLTSTAKVLPFDTPQAVPTTPCNAAAAGQPASAVAASRGLGVPIVDGDELAADPDVATMFSEEEDAARKLADAPEPPAEARDAQMAALEQQIREARANEQAALAREQASFTALELARSVVDQRAADLDQRRRELDARDYELDAREEDLAAVDAEVEKRVDLELKRCHRAMAKWSEGIPPIFYDASRDLTSFVALVRQSMLRREPPPTFPAAELDDPAEEAPTTPPPLSIWYEGESSE